ncbi:MAG: dihydroorotase [Kastovskya adunca ATA6-11-RM4]|jgi:dihydroorotase|nr:dihydroorotase [Kastovskya adunca ATA6-11-RM4]
MTNSELLRQVRVLDPVSDSDRLADVLIADGVIKAVETEMADVPAETTVRDCQGLILGPGLVDLYSHSGEPGFEERETLDSLTSSAAAGGFTRLALLPDTMPPIDNPGGLAMLRQKLLGINGKTASLPPRPAAPLLFHFWGAITQDIAGQQMTELAELAAAGVVGFADGRPLSNLGMLRRVLEYLRPLNQPVALWACSQQLQGNGVMREGSASLRFGLPGNPAIAESAALAALLEVVEAIATPVHIMRVSTRRGVELLQDAKARGLPITASTTWMHLLLNTEAVGSYEPNLRLEPPLGTPRDQQALLEAVKSGVIEAIAIDHTPYTYEEKTVAFAEAPPGVIGLELALPLLWENLVTPGKWSAVTLWRCLSTNPAQCLQTKPGAIAPGEPAELTLFDPQATWRVDRQSLNSLSVNTPWLGKQLTGRVLKTWCER